MAVFPAGHILTSADLDLMFPTGIGAWTPFTPSLVQSNSPTKASDCAYAKIGRTVIARYSLVLSSAGTAANGITIGLPVTAAAGEVGIAIGDFWFNDAGTGFYSGVCRAASQTAFNLFNGGSTLGAMGATGGGFTAALATGDQITAALKYEAAS